MNHAHDHTLIAKDDYFWMWGVLGHESSGMKRFIVNYVSKDFRESNDFLNELTGNKDTNAFEPEHALRLAITHQEEMKLFDQAIDAFVSQKNLRDADAKKVELRETIAAFKDNNFTVIDKPGFGLMLCESFDPEPALTISIGKRLVTAIQLAAF